MAEGPEPRRLPKEAKPEGSPVPSTCWILRADPLPLDLQGVLSSVAFFRAERRGRRLESGAARNLLLGIQDVPMSRQNKSPELPELHCEAACVRWNWSGGRHASESPERRRSAVHRAGQPRRPVEELPVASDRDPVVLRVLRASQPWAGQPRRPVRKWGGGRTCWVGKLRIGAPGTVAQTLAGSHPLASCERPTAGGGAGDRSAGSPDYLAVCDEALAGAGKWFQNTLLRTASRDTLTHAVRARRRAREDVEETCARMFEFRAR